MLNNEIFVEISYAYMDELHLNKENDSEILENPDNSSGLGFYGRIRCT
jgi:hypothetical protein